MESQIHQNSKSVYDDLGIYLACPIDTLYWRRFSTPEEEMTRRLEQTS
jgi:hypothetical protein